MVLVFPPPSLISFIITKLMNKLKVAQLSTTKAHCWWVEMTVTVHVQLGMMQSVGVK